MEAKGSANGSAVNLQVQELASSENFFEEINQIPSFGTGSKFNALSQGGQRKINPLKNG